MLVVRPPPEELNVGPCRPVAAAGRVPLKVLLITASALLLERVLEKGIGVFGLQYGVCCR